MTQAMKILDLILVKIFPRRNASELRTTLKHWRSKTRAAEETAHQRSVGHNFVQLMAICRTMAGLELSKHRQLFQK